MRALAAQQPHRARNILVHLTQKSPACPSAWLLLANAERRLGGDHQAVLKAALDHMSLTDAAGIESIHAAMDDGADENIVYVTWPLRLH